MIFLPCSRTKALYCERKVSSKKTQFNGWRLFRANHTRLSDFLFFLIFRCFFFCKNKSRWKIESYLPCKWRFCFVKSCHLQRVNLKSVLLQYCWVVCSHFRNWKGDPSKPLDSFFYEDNHTLSTYQSGANNNQLKIKRIIDHFILKKLSKRPIDKLSSSQVCIRYQKSTYHSFPPLSSWIKINFATEMLFYLIFQINLFVQITYFMLLSLDG